MGKHLEYQIYKYSLSTNIWFELSELSAREVLFFGSRKKRAGGGAGEKRKNQYSLNLARASELKKSLTLNLSSRRIYKLQAKISGHAVYINFYTGALNVDTYVCMYMF